MQPETEVERSAREAQRKQMERNKAEDHFAIYANNTQIQTTAYDFNIDYGRVIGTETQSDKEVLLVEDKVRVILSPAHAKAVAMILLNQVARYEQRFGTLPETVKVPMELSITLLDSDEDSQEE
jgi:hypothetical protein